MGKVFNYETSLIVEVTLLPLDQLGLFSPHGAKMYALTSQKVFKCERDVSITIFIIPLENIRHAFQGYTALYKNIEAHFPPPALFKAPVQQLYKLVGQPIAKSDKRLLVFFQGDRPGSVFVKPIEE